LAVSYEFGYFERDRRIILLTATPDPACNEALNTLAQAGVRIARIEGNQTASNPTPSQTQFTLNFASKRKGTNLLKRL